MKRITIAIVAILGIAIVGMVGSVAAADLIIETEFEVSGTGSFSRDLLVQTELGYAGKRLSETYYTRWLGTDGDSKLAYKSALEVYMGNSTEFENETVTEIVYAQTAESTNAKQLVCAANYDVGALQGIGIEGNALRSFETVMDDRISEFNIEAAVEGSARLMQKAVDPSTRLRYVDEDTRLVGQYKFNWSAYVELPSYPEGEECWLSCP